MRVFIAEKPSLARAIFEGLGGNPDTEKLNGYYQHGIRSKRSTRPPKPIRWMRKNA